MRFVADAPIVREMDFSHWEKQYVRHLNELERVELATNFREFFELLGELQIQNLDYLLESIQTKLVVGPISDKG